MILVIDNYDSFTYNIIQYMGKFTKNFIVYKNDEITLEELKNIRFDKILISPGPKSPSEAGISKDVINYFAGKKPILGICLGHQAIGEVFGGKTIHAPSVIHGKTSIIKHDGKGIFEGVASNIEVGRYHSLVIDPKTFPKEHLEITAQTEGIIMGVRHKKHKIEGVQFHPESILTKQGLKMIENFVKKF
ncbi:anthranilate synthase component II [Paramaledivibacter caminithermalis]|uniref:Anthranilate synthase, component II n=1 Tax=Paramaledivibacter caminithermalis (strain DSM 15212 / CIP 107654 / DViRD3) TaxID=1121301 RepID=A0A1M6T4P9_PARC5|nr:aminodeoxychorismate/anthranilate synthase component II [Paramaledivibacter caminithermalis]SHK51894.1 anthranilate synthase, component II [Paramaledivibacter caminithermalis DSM 15212]